MADYPLFSPYSKNNPRNPPLDATRHKQLIGALPSERTVICAPHSVSRVPPSTRSSFLGVNTSSSVHKPSVSISSTIPKSSSKPVVSSSDSTNTTDLPPITSFRSEDGSRLFATCGKTFVSRLNADAWRRYCVVQYQEQITRSRTSTKILQSFQHYQQQLNESAIYANSQNNSAASSRNPSREASPEPIKRSISFSTTASPVSTTAGVESHHGTVMNSMFPPTVVSLNTSVSSFVDTQQQSLTPGRKGNSNADHKDTILPASLSPYQIYMTRSPRKENHPQYHSASPPPSSSSSSSSSSSKTIISSLPLSPIVPNSTKRVSIRIDGEDDQQSSNILPNLPPPSTVPTTESTETVRDTVPEKNNFSVEPISSTATALDQRFANVENQLKNILIENKILREKIETTEALLIHANLENHTYQQDIERLQKELDSTRKLIELSSIPSVSSAPVPVSATSMVSTNEIDDQKDEQIRTLRQDLDKLRKLILDKDTQINQYHEKEQTFRQEIASLTMRAAAASGMALIRIGSSSTSNTGSPLNSPRAPSINPSVENNVTPSKDNNTPSTKPEASESTSTNKESSSVVPSSVVTNTSNPLNQEKSPLAKRRWQALSTLQQTGTLTTLATNEETVNNSSSATPRKIESNGTDSLLTTTGEGETTPSTPRTPNSGLFALAAAASTNPRNTMNNNNRTPVLGLLATAALRSQQQQQSSNRSSPLLTSSLLSSSRRPSGITLPGSSFRLPGEDSTVVVPSFPLSSPTTATEEEVSI